jgi:prepilin-type N-terminal cleavage/methylation domain-containing protein
MVRSRSRRASARGFTLIELMVVVSCISILTTIGIPGYSMLKARARHAEFVNQMELLVHDLQLYWRSTGSAPGPNPQLANSTQNPAGTAGSQEMMDWTTEPWKSVKQATNAPIEFTRVRYVLRATPTDYILTAYHDFDGDGIISQSSTQLTSSGTDLARLDVGWDDFE